MKIKIFCRCFFFLPGRAKDLSAPCIEMIYKETNREDVEWIQLTQNRL
jgi:hypothetical protein